MEKKIITIGRQFGSGGKAIAELLGKSLGYPVYDKELIHIAAKESGMAPEFFEKADEKSSKGVFGTLFGTGPINPVDPLLPMGGFLNNDKLFELQSNTIRDIAEKGSAIFIGRCADYVLRDREDMISFFISSPLKHRIYCVAGELDISEKEAENMILHKDKKRSEYYNYYTFKKWGLAESYDICLCSFKLGIEESAGLIERIISEK